MLVVAPVLVVGLVAGVVGAAAAHRWPRAVAPRVAARAVGREVAAHPTVGHAARSLDPVPATAVALGLSVAAVASALAGVGALLAMVETGSGLARWDLAAARFGARNASEGSTSALRWISEVGGTRGALLLALVAVLVAWRSGRRRVPLTQVAAFAVLVVGGQFLLSNVAKLVVDRPRPDLLNLTGFAGTSFPSGHATAAAATLAAVALLLARGRSRRSQALLFGAATGLAAMVAATRVLLGVHWLTDVLAGLLLGWGWFGLCSVAVGGRLLHFGAPAEQAAAAADAVDAVDAVDDGRARAPAGSPSSSAP